MNTTNPNLVYRVKSLDKGFMAQCAANPEVSVYAESRDEIDDRINKALQGYIDLFPYKVDKSLVEDRTKRITEGQ